MIRGRACAALVLFSANLGCAGLVGITDVPGGDGGAPALDAHLVVLADGRVVHVLPDGNVVGFDVVPPVDGHRTGLDAGVPMQDGTLSDAGADADGPGPRMTLSYTPSNLGASTFNAAITGPLTLSSDNCVLYTDDQIITCASGQNPSMDMQSVTLAGGAGEAVVFVFTDISIDASSGLQIRGTKPGILVVLGSVNLSGTIDVSADNFGQSGMAIPGVRTSGAGVGAFGNSGGPQGGGGGSFCGTGGHGAPASSDGFAPGMPYGNASLVPLWGGSAGGGANTGGADLANGNGGGALQISAAGNIIVHGGAVINANGSGGVSQGNEQGEGAGSGGSILLEAPTIQIDGLLEANGGQGSDEKEDGADPPADGGVASKAGCIGGNGGAGAQKDGSNGGLVDGGFGGGGGGVGWIRLNGTSVTITGTITPSVASGCASKAPLPP